MGAKTVSTIKYLTLNTYHLWHHNKLKTYIRFATSQNCPDMEMVYQKNGYNCKSCSVLKASVCWWSKVVRLHSSLAHMKQEWDAKHETLHSLSQQIRQKPSTRNYNEYKNTKSQVLAYFLGLHKKDDTRDSSVRRAALTSVEGDTWRRMLF